jgi:hypothetical protein
MRSGALPTSFQALLVSRIGRLLLTPGSCLGHSATPRVRPSDFENQVVKQLVLSTRFQRLDDAPFGPSPTPLPSGGEVHAPVWEAVVSLR